MTHEYLHAKIRVGSCKNASVNYKTAAHVFHHDDVPYYAREKAKEIKDFKASTILKVNNYPWNKKSQVDRPVYDKPTRQNFEKDRSGAMVYNYRAEVNYPSLIAPVDKPTKFHMSSMLAEDALKVTSTQRDSRIQRGLFYRTKELPNNPKLENALEWNASNKEDSSLRKSFFNAKTDKAKINSMRVAHELNQLDYIPPIKQSAAVTKQVRDLKRSGLFDHKTMSVTRPKTKVIPEEFEKRNRSALEPSRKYKHHYHSGVYEFNKTEGKYMWSDTGSYFEEDDGDVQQVHNPDGYNYVGPTLAPAVGFVPAKKRINLIEKGKKPKLRYGLDGELLPQAF